MSQPLIVIAEFAATPETFEAFLKTCHYDSERSLADEEGCLAFDVLTEHNASDTIILHEVYRNRAAFDAHLKTPHFEKFSTSLRELKIKERSIRLFSRHTS